MQRRIKILFTIPNFITAGSGREMFNIIEHLDNQTYEPWILVQQSGGKIFDEAVAKKYPVIESAFTASEPNKLNRVLSIIKLAFKFRKYGFDVWQSFNWSSDFTESIIARLAGAKYVYVKKSMNWQIGSWKLKSRLSNAIVARNTTLIEKYFSTEDFKRKAYLITGGVDTYAFKPIRSNFRAQHSIPADAYVICCVAQIVRIKDQVTLIQAMAKTEHTFLVLAGAEKDDTYAQEVRSEIDLLGLSDQVLMLGSCSGVNDLLNAANCFVLPTTNKYEHEEGCPVSVLEAMAAQIPCIVSDVAGSRDLIVDHETGLLFQPGNAAELARCISTYVDNPDIAIEYAQKAYQKIQKEHTLLIEAKAFEHVYKHIMK